MAILLNDFVIQKVRPLLVIVAVDRCGSMSKEAKMDALNLALWNFSSLKTEKSDIIEIQVAKNSFEKRPSHVVLV